ncbi:hypothetical protein [Peribacillus alkalitolerans]|uniref:hypothetical protein n=1 Tax=Peribacillus alkalitolerans TaxID=1550385 RepID=UPI0013CFD727|nr:hypothetical protein [Peribacillus alkalitolerans]
MKKCLSLLLVIGLLFGLPISTSLANSHDGEKTNDHPQNHHLKHVDKEKIAELEKQGFTRKEIFHALHFAKYSGKTVEEVLKIYKEQGSWDLTAKELGMDFKQIHKKQKEKFEKLYQENKEPFNEYLANYSGTDKATIENYLKSVPYHKLFKAAVLAKTTDQSLSDVMKKHEEGKKLKDMFKEENVDHKKVHAEFMKIHRGLMKIAKKDTNE